MTVGGSRYEALKHIHVPTLVVHGEADKMIPIEHGKRLVQTLPGAKGLWLPQAGHVFPYPDMDYVNQEIIKHLIA